MGKTVQGVVIGASTVTTVVKDISIKEELGVISGVTIIIDNTGGTYNGVFSVNDTVDVDLGGANFFNGWVDSVQPFIEDNPDIFTQKLQIEGRNYARELTDYTLDKYYVNQPADDIIDNMLSEVGSNITYTSPGSGTVMSYDSKDNYLFNSFRDIADRDGKDWFVDTDYSLKYFARGSQSSSITLQTGQNSNVLDIRRNQSDGMDIKNKIIVRGKKVDDGWSEFNHGDFKIPTDGAIDSDTGNYAVGASSIRFKKSTATATWIELDFTNSSASNWDSSTNTLYGRSSLNWRGIAGGELKFKIFFPTILGSEAFELRLTDSHGNVIGNKSLGTYDMGGGWKTKSYSIGTDVSIANVASRINDKWRYTTEAANITNSDYTSLDIDAADANGRAVLTASGGTPFSSLSAGDVVSFVSAEDDTNNSWNIGEKVVYSVSANSRVLTLTGQMYVDNGADTSIQIRRRFNWNVTKITWDASDSGSFGFSIDGLSLPEKMFSVKQDATSQSSYGVRELVVRKTDIESQQELELYASTILTQRKDAVETISITSPGATGISGFNNKWKPGYTVTVNVPGEGISSVSYRIISLIHRWSDEQTFNGYDFWTDVQLAKTSDIIDQKRLDALKNDLALLQEIRESLRYLEQREEEFDIGYPPLPNSLETYYPISNNQWKQSWQVEKLPMSISTATDSVAAGTNTVSDTTASEGIAAVRLSSASTGRMFGSQELVPPGGATYAVGCLMKVASTASTATIFQLQVYRDQGTGGAGNVATFNVAPSDFTADGAYEFVYVRAKLDPEHTYRIRGQFTTGITDVTVDWVGVTDGPVAYASAGGVVDANATGLTNTDNATGLNNSSGATGLTNTAGATGLNNSSGATALANDSASAHQHDVSYTAGYVVTGYAAKWALSASSSNNRYALGSSITSTLYAFASASTASALTAFKAIPTGTSLYSFKAIPTGTTFDSINAPSLSSATNVTTGTSTNNGGSHNHTHSSDSHNHNHGTDSHPHSHGSDSHNHTHGSDSHPHAHGADSHDHTSTEGIGHKH